MTNDEELQLLDDNSINKFTVVNNLYGKITEAPLNVRVIEDNYEGTKSKKVMLDNQVEAFIELGEPSKEFDFKIISSEIAELFDIKVMPIHRLKGNNQHVGIVRRSIAESEEKAITFGQIARSLFTKINSGELDGKLWLDSITKIASTKEAIVDEETIKMIIEMPLYLVMRSFANVPLEYIRFKKEYLQAIIFDYITNQAKRSLDNYSIVINNKNKKTSFGALYSFEIQQNEGIEAGEYILNTNIINRETLINCIYKNYYSEIEDFSKMIFDYMPDYQKSLELILRNNFNNEEYQTLLSIMITNLKKIGELEKKYNGDKNKNHIDMTKTNISLQLKAKTNNNDVLAKYPELEFLEAEKTDDELEQNDGVKLTLEPDRRRSGFVNGTLIIILIVFIITVGIGIGYLIFNFSGV